MYVSVSPTLIALAGGAPSAAAGAGTTTLVSFFGLLDKSMDGSDDLLEPLVAGETKPIVLIAYQTHNKPIYYHN